MPKPVLFGLLAFLAVLLWLVRPHAPALPPTASQRTKRPAGVTHRDYRDLRLNQLPTTYAQAVAQLGEGAQVEESADGRTRTYQWSGGGRWARLEATFYDRSAVGKQQFMLEN